MIAKMLFTGALLFSALPASAQHGPQQADTKIDGAERQRLIDTLVNRLDQYYVFPDKAKKIGAALRAHQKSGHYDRITSSETLAKTLNEHMSAEAQDKHLQVYYSEQPIPEDTDDTKTSDEEMMGGLANMRAHNFGVERIERLPFNIGYLNLSAFAPAKSAAATIAATMATLTYTDALIIDLRENGGGDPSTVSLIASYLLDERTHLSDMYYRKRNVTEQMWTMPSLGGPHYGQKKEVYILTSKDTFSAAEDLSYTLKHLKRATIVGEATGGGAHPGDMVRLSAHMHVFMPNGRSINPITKTNWEGVGVAPDMSVAAEDALKTAQIAVLNKFMGAEKNPGKVARIKQRIAKLAGAPAASGAP